MVQCGRNLESLEKNSLLSLESDILWPSDESGQISSGLDITSDSEVSWGLLEKRILLCLGDLDVLGTLLKFSLSL